MFVIGIGIAISISSLKEFKNVNENKKGNLNHNAVSDEFKLLEEKFINFKQLPNKGRDVLEEKCANELKSNFCTVIYMYDEKDLEKAGLYFINNQKLYFGDVDEQKLYEIENIEGNPIKIVYAFFSSDESFPVIGILTDKKVGYLTSNPFYKEQNSKNAIENLTNFIKIDSNESISDIIFMQNYEIYRNDEFDVGYALPFIKINNAWKILDLDFDKDGNISKINSKEWLSNLRA